MKLSYIKNLRQDMESRKSLTTLDSIWVGVWI